MLRAVPANLLPPLVLGKSLADEAGFGAERRDGRADLRTGLADARAGQETSSFSEPRRLTDKREAPKPIGLRSLHDRNAVSKRLLVVAGKNIIAVELVRADIALRPVRPRRTAPVGSHCRRIDVETAARRIGADASRRAPTRLLRCAMRISR